MALRPTLSSGLPSLSILHARWDKNAEKHHNSMNCLKIPNISKTGSEVLKSFKPYTKVYVVYHFLFTFF